ncbi:MAG: bifunctional serine/threonine-protein kinase/formylglycine-generating enzyme family protein [Bryobacteraceae bacterium]
MQLPARIGKYELEEFLGGGMSHVYRARDTVIGRTVAVKILTEAGCADAETKTRFLAEARMAGNLAHDNIISIYDFGEDENGHPFLVMEFLRGEDLRNAIRDGHTGDLRAKLKIALQVGRALEYIHSQGIVHRDIKPENVHRNSAGVVKLMDFGIAKAAGMSLTRAGYVLGTPYYMAPEQVTGQDVTGQVDVYAFGVLLFELLSGKKPISGDTMERIFYSILNEPLNLDPLRQAGVPPAICDLVARCTAKTPAARPQGFGAVCAEIEQYLGNTDAPTELLPQAPAPAAVRRTWLAPAIMALALAAGAGTYFVVRPKPVPVTHTKSLPATISTSTGAMLLVAAGTFEYGGDKRPMPLAAFYIDKTEVPNSAYAAFCKATGRKLPDGFPADKPDLPVVDVTITDAHAFAAWAGKRLPNDEEWEKAARGVDGRSFPWGNQPDPSRANLNSKGLRPVGDFADGASPCGAVNMIGNAWELVEQLTPPSKQAIENFADLLTPPPTADEPWYLIRGTSFKYSLDPRAIWDKTTAPARFKGSDIGFRCAKDAD